jgi:hypothetical protein
LLNKYFKQCRRLSRFAFVFVKIADVTVVPRNLSKRAKKYNNFCAHIAEEKHHAFTIDSTWYTLHDLHSMHSC